MYQYVSSLHNNHYQTTNIAFLSYIRIVGRGTVKLSYTIIAKRSDLLPARPHPPNPDGLNRYPPQSQCPSLEIVHTMALPILYFPFHIDLHHKEEKGIGSVFTVEKVHIWES